MGPTRDRSLTRDLIIGFVLFASAFLFAWFSTSDGMVIGQRDSPSYLSSAENLARGLGYVTSYGDPGKAVDFDDPTSAVVDFPPGYPVALGLVTSLTDDVLSAARVLSSLILGSIGLAVFWVSRRRGLSRLWSLVSAVVAILMTLPYAISPLSEPLYGLVVVGVLAALAASRKSESTVILGIAVALAALGVTVRTVGVALVATVVIVTLLSRRPPHIRVLWSLAALAAGAAAFFALVGGGTRTIAWHPPGLESLKILSNTVASWIIPPFGGPWLRVFGALVVIGGLVYWVYRRGNGQFGRSIDSAWVPGVVSAAMHLGVLLVTRALVDAQTEANLRLAYPVALSILVACIEVAAKRVDTDKPVLQALAVVAVLAMGAGFGLSVDAVSSSGEDKRFASDQFRQSDSVAELDSMSGQFAVFSNVPDGLWVAGVSGARPLPVAIDPLSLQPSPRLDNELARLEKEVNDNNAVIHYYRRHQRDYLVELQRLQEFASCVIADDQLNLVLAAPTSPLCRA